VCTGKEETPAGYLESDHGVKVVDQRKYRNHTWGGWAFKKTKKRLDNSRNQYGPSSRNPGFQMAYQQVGRTVFGARCILAWVRQWGS